ncbi:hypothetical protein GQ42DRAFT_176418 [Ramicandelaber brevisporus]|nr:hypothetical protein GQ42DRAFT_176418 [Ramicandelaber brevisporus]
MDIGKLLNPVPNKRPRFDRDSLICDEYWLPTELIAYIISFFDFLHRPKFRLVSKEWNIAYDLYHRNKVFDDYDHVIKKRVTRRQVLNAFAEYGRRLRWMRIHTSTLREILDFEPNFADLMPNAVQISIVVNDGLSSLWWMGDFVMKLFKLKILVIQEFGSTADDHLAYEMDRAVAVMPRLGSVMIDDIDLDLNAFPGPNMKERARQILELVISVANIEPGMVGSTFKMFKNVRRLGFTGISSADVLKEVTEMVVDKKNFRKLQFLEVRSEFDLSHADPIVNEEYGTKVTAMDLYLKICGIRRPNFELRVGFILGACSTTDSALIEREREFVINLGKTGADVLARLEITHYTPVGDYDPLTTLFYHSAPRFPNLLFLYIHVSPTAATGPRIIDALNNPFLLPHIVQVRFYVDGTQSPEWNRRFNPIHRSRGFHFSVREKQHEDRWRILNENNDGVLPSRFLS